MARISGSRNHARQTAETEIIPRQRRSIIEIEQAGIIERRRPDDAQTEVVIQIISVFLRQDRALAERDPNEVIGFRGDVIQAAIVKNEVFRAGGRLVGEGGMAQVPKDGMRGRAKCVTAEPRGRSTSFDIVQNSRGLVEGDRL